MGEVMRGKWTATAQKERRLFGLDEGDDEQGRNRMGRLSTSPRERERERERDIYLRDKQRLGQTGKLNSAGRDSRWGMNRERERMCGWCSRTRKSKKNVRGRGEGGRE